MEDLDAFASAEEREKFKALLPGGQP
jgi:hypothetical protein